MKKLLEIKIKNCDTLKLIKRDKSKFYYAKFYVGKGRRKDGYLFLSLKTSNKTNAIKKAKEVWFDFISKNKLTKKNDDSSVAVYVKKVAPELTFDYFFNKCHIDSLEQESSGGLFKGTSHSRKFKYDNCIKHFIGQKSVKDIDTNDLDKIKKSLLNKNLELKTIKGYFTLVKHALNKALELNAIDKILRMPIIKLGKRNPYQPYSKEEVNQITEELRRISKTDKSYGHYNEVADIVNFLYFVPLRPGKEFLSLQHKDVKLIDSVHGKILIIDPPHRKVAQNTQPIPSHPIARDIYLNRICKRYPNETGKEYLFFNKDPKRRTLQKKIYKIFRKVTKSLGIYEVAGSKRNRPLYSIRTANFIETYAKSGNAELLARIGNTSINMLDRSYLQKFSSSKLVEVYQKLYSVK